MSSFSTDLQRYTDFFDIDPDLIPLGIEIVTKGIGKLSCCRPHSKIPKACYYVVDVETPNFAHGTKGRITLSSRIVEEPQIPRDIATFPIFSFLGYDVRLDKSHLEIAQRKKDLPPIVFSLVALVVKDRGAITFAIKNV